MSKKDKYLRTAVKAYEKKSILGVLQVCNWNVPKTAKALGIGLSSLYRKINKYGIKRKGKEKDVASV